MNPLEAVGKSSPCSCNRGEQHMETTSASKRVRVTDPVEARAELLKPSFKTPADAKNTREAIEAIEVAAYAYARCVCAQQSKAEHDKGRIIASIDAIKNSRDTAIAAFELPHVTKEVPEVVSADA